MMPDEPVAPQEPTSVVTAEIDIAALATALGPQVIEKLVEVSVPPEAPAENRPAE